MLCTPFRCSKYNPRLDNTGSAVLSSVWCTKSKLSPVPWYGTGNAGSESSALHGSGNAGSVAIYPVWSGNAENASSVHSSTGKMQEFRESSPLSYMVQEMQEV